MNKASLTCLSIIFCFSLYAQQMHVKQPNFATFSKQESKTSPLLDKLSSTTAKQHPEYGILPFNAQCRECVELIDKRTIDGRFFIDPTNEGHTWSQQSYFPLHYKNSENDVWHTIDQRLKAVVGQPGVYVANNQPVPTKCDLNKKNASLNLGEMEFEFNNDISMYFFEEGKAYTQTQKGDYTHTNIGEEGLVAYGIWNGIDMRQLFQVGQIKTNYVINSPLSIPVGDNGWMVIEDHFSIPAGYTFEEATPGKCGKEKYYTGDYVLKNPKGEIILTYEKPIYTDANAFGMHGDYQLKQEGNSYTLQMLIPISWLKNPNNVYPIIIDPIIYGATKLGDYRSTGFPSASMAFTSYDQLPLGYCPYHMTVKVPGKSQLTNTYYEVEWQLTFDNTCQPSQQAPFNQCTYNQVFQDLVCDQCGTVSHVVCSKSNNPNYIGTCTTDPAAGGFDSMPIITIPPFLGCIGPQCEDYNIGFTLRNMDSVCNESCNYLCARGNIWKISVEGCQVGGFITQDKGRVCAGEPITYTAHPSCGVPPYHYQWFHGSNYVPDTTIYGSPNFINLPPINLVVYCIIYDTCGVSAITNSLSDTVLSPMIIISMTGDSLISSFVSGNQWYRNDSILEGDTGQVYVVTQPGLYTVQVDSNGCISTFSNPIDLTCKAFFVIYPDSSVQGDYYGHNQSTGTNLHYIWYFGDGDTSNLPYPIHIYTQPGHYNVCLTVGDGNGCTDTYCDSSFYVGKKEGSLMKQLTILNPATGTADLGKNTSINIYPNPTTNELIIKAEGFQAQLISVFDINGRKVKERKFVSKLDVSQLAPGTYFLEIKGGDVTARKRFVKE